MITITPYTSKYFDALSAYELDEVQATFAMEPKYILTDLSIMENTARTQYCILHNDEVVGFFSLDLSDDRLIYTQNTSAILLRALSIMPQYQGKGMAKETMLLLPDFVKANFSKVTEIVFGVNFENTSAYNLYIKTHYTDTGKVYQGVKGPQYCMSKQLF